MPEQIIESQDPLGDAIAKVTEKGWTQWQLTGWTTARISNDPTYFYDNTSPCYATSGMKGVVARPKGTGGSRNFTIRHDYDFAKGMNPNGKGYHVNVELPDEKYAFYQPNGDKLYYTDCIQMLNERRLQHGDDEASKWFMRCNNRPSINLHGQHHVPPQHHAPRRPRRPRRPGLHRQSAPNQ